MSGIDSTGKFLRQIAEQVSAIGRQSAPLAKAPVRAQAGRKGPPPSLQALVVQRVRAIGDEDPQRRRKAFRIFLESILSAELGGQLINDPAFHQMVDNVQQSMEANPELLPAIERAGDFLLASARKKG